MLRDESSNPQVDSTDLIELVEQSASSELYSVLKRPDEKEVTERAYDNPVFVEDLVREIALGHNTGLYTFEYLREIWEKLDAKS